MSKIKPNFNQFITMIHSNVHHHHSVMDIILSVFLGSACALSFSNHMLNFFMKTEKMQFALLLVSVISFSLICYALIYIFTDQKENNLLFYFRILILGVILISGIVFRQLPGIASFHNRLPTLQIDALGDKNQKSGGSWIDVIDISIDDISFPIDNFSQTGNWSIGQNGATISTNEKGILFTQLPIKTTSVSLLFIEGPQQGITKIQLNQNVIWVDLFNETDSYRSVQLPVDNSPSGGIKFISFISDVLAILLLLYLLFPLSLFSISTDNKIIPSIKIKQTRYSFIVGVSSILMIVFTTFGLLIGYPHKITLHKENIEKYEGYCFKYSLDKINLPPIFLVRGDNINHTQQSLTLLFENNHFISGVPRFHSIHNTIVQEGLGRFSHWDSTIYFSTSDNSDALNNGRDYTALVWIVVKPGFAILLISVLLIFLFLSRDWLGNWIFRNVYKFVLITFALLSYTLLIGLIVIILSKGIYSRETGLMMLCYNQQITFITSTFSNIPKIFPWIPVDIVSYRKLRFICDLIFGLTIVLSFFNWVKHNKAIAFSKVEVVFISCMIFISCLSYPFDYIYDPLSHHDIVRWTAMIGMSLLFLAMTSSNRAYLSFAFSISFCMGFFILNKIPSLSLLSICFFFALFITRTDRNTRLFLQLLSIYIIGLAFGLILNLSLFTDFKTWIQSILSTMPSNSGSMSQVINNEPRELLDIILSMINYLPWYILIFTITVLKRKISHRIFLYISNLIILLVMAIPIINTIFYWQKYHPVAPFWIDSVSISTYYDIRNLYLLTSYPLIIMVSMGLFLVVTECCHINFKKPIKLPGTTEKNNLHTLIILVTTFLIPVICGIFSGRQIIKTIVENIWSWMIFFPLCSMYITKKPFSFLYQSIFCILPFVLLLSQQYGSFLYRYESLTRAITDYSYVVPELPKGKDLQFSEGEASYYREIYQILTNKGGFKLNDPVYYLFGSENEIFLSGGYVTFEPDDNTFIITSDPIDTQTILEIQNKGLPFPEEYSLLGIVHGDAWVEKSVRIYAPSE